jgi:CheY-like chemotaxis protein
MRRRYCCRGLLVDQVVSVATVDEAIQALDREDFDVVVTDLKFGRDRSGGVRVARVASTKQTPVVILTSDPGFADQELRKQSMKGDPLISVVDKMDGPREIREFVKKVLLARQR